MKEYRLTVAIPTYNRKKYLEECLKSVIAQTDETIEVLVCDNASSDGTAGLLKKYHDDFGIHVCRNKKNLGMDGNFYKCLTKARGRYIHLLSDDDILLPGALDAILNVIEKHIPELIHLNSCEFRPGSRRLSAPRLSLKKDIITQDKELFMSVTGIYITFLSSLVLKREAVESPGALRQFIGTYFLHAHAALRCTSGADKTMAIVSHNSVAARTGNTGGYNLYTVWIREYKRLLLHTAVFAGYSRSMLKQLYIRSLKTEIRGFILSFRSSEGGLSVDKPWRLVFHTFMYPEVWLTVYPAAFAPKILLPLFL